MSDQFDRFHDDHASAAWTPHDDLPAYALDVLAPAEREAFEVHLAGCGACASELAAQRRLGDLLPYGLPTQQPPAGARERLLARARAEADNPPPMPASEPPRRPTPISAQDSRSPQPAVRDGIAPTAQPPRRTALEPIPSTRIPPARLPEQPRRRRIRLASLGWAAALLFVLSSGLFVGAWSATGPHASPVVELQARLPGGQILPLVGTGVPTAKARLFVVGGGQQAELAVDRLPPLPPGRIYQLWFAEPGQPIKTGGTFSVDASGDAVARVTIPAPLERMRAVAVTEEPAPGSPGPTGEHLLDWTPQ